VFLSGPASILKAHTSSSPARHGSKAALQVMYKAFIGLHKLWSGRWMEYGNGTAMMIELDMV
jgi:hypothetical protein